MPYTDLSFGGQVESHWGILNVLDGGEPAPIIAVRGEFWTPEAEACFLRLSETHAVIGLCSYQCFPEMVANPHENRGPDTREGGFVSEYGHLVSFWCHCFRDPDLFLPLGVPRSLLSESDFMVPDHIRKYASRDKTWDMACTVLEGEWNAWIRRLPVVARWMNAAAEELGMRVLVVGPVSNKHLFSPKVDVVPQLPYYEFIERVGRSGGLFCASGHDASPRVLVEAMFLGVPILVSEGILGGWKYVNSETGAFFSDSDAPAEALRDFAAGSRSRDPWGWASRNVVKAEASARLAEMANAHALSPPAGPSAR